jgi:hypothetical protein
MKILILTLSQISPLQPWHNQPQQKNPVRCTPPRSPVGQGQRASEHACLPSTGNARICRLQREDRAESGFRPDLKGAETATILQKAGILVRESHLLARAELPVTADLNIREVSQFHPDGDGIVTV